MEVSLSNLKGSFPSEIKIVTGRREDTFSSEDYLETPCGPPPLLPHRRPSSGPPRRVPTSDVTHREFPTVWKGVSGEGVLLSSRRLKKNGVQDGGVLEGVLPQRGLVLRPGPSRTGHTPRVYTLTRDLTVNTLTKLVFEGP